MSFKPNTDQLTFTRFLAAVLIVLFHFGGVLLGDHSKFINIIYSHFNLGVNYFYVLSGFVMMLAYGKYEKIDAKAYLIHRFARLYPLHLFTLGLTIAVSLAVAINYLKDYQFDASSFILNLLLIQAWVPQHSLSYNVPSWSISVELFFYLCFPFLYNTIYRRKSLFRFALFSFGIWSVSQILLNAYYSSPEYGGYNSLDRYFLLYNPLFHINSFIIGLFFGAVYKKYLCTYAGNWDFLILVLLCINLALIYFLNKYLLHNGLLSPIFGLLILMLSINTGKITEVFSNKRLVYLGNISFAMYLLQNPVFIFLNKCMKVLKIENEYLLFFLGFTLLIVSSHFTYKIIEIPLQRKIRKYANR